MIIITFVVDAVLYSSSRTRRDAAKMARSKRYLNAGVNVTYDKDINVKKKTDKF